MEYIFCLEQLLLPSDRTKLFLADPAEQEALSTSPDYGNGFCIRDVLFVLYIADTGMMSNIIFVYCSNNC